MQNIGNALLVIGNLKGRREQVFNAETNEEKEKKLRLVQAAQDGRGASLESEGFFLT